MVEVRVAQDADNGRISEIHRDTWRKAYKGLIPDEIIAEFTSENRKRGGGNSSPPDDKILQSRLCLVGLVDGKVEGFAVGGLPREQVVPADCELWAIYVHPEAQGRGVGRALCEEFMILMRERGHKKMVLWVLKENHPSRKFYEAIDGKLIAEEKMFNFDGRDVAGESGYVWEL